MKNPKIRFCKLYNCDKRVFNRMIKLRRFFDPAIPLKVIAHTLSEEFGININKGDVFHWLKQDRVFRRKEEKNPTKIK